MEQQQNSFWASKKKQDKMVSLVLYLIAWTGALIFVIPLVWMVSTSLKYPTDIFTTPPKWLPISNIQWKADSTVRSQQAGYVKLAKGANGTQVIYLMSSTKRTAKVVDTMKLSGAAKLNVEKGVYVKEGDIVAELPKTGVARVNGNIIMITDKDGNIIDTIETPPNSKIKVNTGDRVNENDRVAVIPPQWHNYMEAWSPKALSETFTTYLLNTIFITVCGLLGTMLSSAFVAYGFSRFKFPYRDQLFLVMVSTMMIPAQVTMIPTFILFKYIGWIDTFAPLIVPTFFGGGAFNIFLMRQFFMTIPYELDDAAKIDGCNYFQIFWLILMPLVKPALVTIAIFGFVYNWNDFMNPLIYLNSSSKYTLALGLQTFTTMYGSYYHLMMAASTIVLLPILIVFFFGQKYFIEGVATSGLKG
ncbi:MAG TPA: carbohydrate ABC transporter permease [Candidatus Goldiibacteriota bacterium]|jgi:multiple sugar transport system permease protein|nr:carbohydrate ABC transporter permease [Candidatus Goldiibacteriota bacterium]HRQ44716.1 carbohydrate ABC transporter permease [Candidatus Goldiibacteriota bacterium]